MTTEAFWRTSPVELDLMYEGYLRRIRPEAEHFRQTYAQTHNHFQLLNAKEPFLIEPIDVLKFPGERRKRKSVKQKGSDWTLEEMAEAARRASISPPTSD